MFCVKGVATNADPHHHQADLAKKTYLMTANRSFIKQATSDNNALLVLSHRPWYWFPLRDTGEKVKSVGHGEHNGSGNMMCAEQSTGGCIVHGSTLDNAPLRVQGDVALLWKAETANFM